MLLVPREILYSALARNLLQLCSDGRLFAAVQHTFLGVLIRPAIANHFLQKLNSFIDEEQRCSVLFRYRGGPEKSKQVDNARLQVVAPQSQRMSTALFELHGNSEVTKVLPLLVPDRTIFGDCVRELPVLELLQICLGSSHGRTSLQT